MRRYAASALAAALLLAGCTQQEPKLADPVTNNVERALKLKVTGARTFSFDGRAPMTFVSRPATGSNAQFSAAALNPIEPLKGSGFVVRPDVGFLGAYAGPGDYTIPAGVSQPIPTTGPTLPSPTGAARNSNIAVTFVDDGKPAVRFGYLLEPCSLRIGKDALDGELRCPKLASIDGKTVAVEMSWGE